MSITVDQQSSSEDLQLLTEYLADRDVPCPRCGYNLRGLTAGRCPECGDHLQLRIGLSEPRLGAYITLLAACCLGLGASALLALIALQEAPSSWWDKPGAKVLLGQFVICALLLPAVLAGRRRFRKGTPKRQWAWAGAMCALIAALSTAIVILFDS